MRTSFLLAVSAGWALAQDVTALRGAYRFVHLSYSEDATSQAGGTLSFDGAGAAQWGETAARYEVTGLNEATLTTETAKLALRFNQGAGVLIGSAAEAGPKHHLLVAVRTAEGMAPQTFRGIYGVASLEAGFATAFAQMTANGAGQFTRAAITGHATGIDDVNRREDRNDLTYELGSDGTGVAHLGSGSDVMNGDIHIAISGDGGILLGWSANGILLGVRKSPDATAPFSFQGRYWMSEMMVENSFAFRQSTRLSSGSGLLSSARNGIAYVSQYILSGGETTYLATTNQYRLSSDGTGALGPKLEAGVDNFAFNETAFVAAQTGPAGQLTLSHGLVFGLAAPPAMPVLSSAAAPSIPDAPVVPGSLMSIAGFFGEAVKVRVNGTDAQLGPVASDRIEFQVPATLEGSGPVNIEVLMGGKVAQTLRAHRAASSPTIYPDAAAKPVEPGETVTLTATGLGAAPTLRVLFDGQPGEVSSTAPVEGQPGRYRIQVVVPKDVNVQAGSSRDVPVALATPDSFIDLADLPVIRK
jgi:uncharacterized protein (TIGR03437 family)